MELNLIGYPKINLCLYVGKKRSDGYHPIASVFQLVEDSFYKDVIKINLNVSDNTVIDVTGLENIADKTDNTVYKAVYLYLDRVDIRADVRIEISKNIPSLAGLGGGSSDAGAILRGLNSVYGRFSDDELFQIALKVGSDVPFFVSGYKTAVAEGRGEILTPLKTRTDLQYKLFPDTAEKKLGTGYAYSQLDKRPIIPDLPSKEYLEEQYFKPVSDWNFSNDFEILYKKVLNRRLTGSGTCRFSVSESL